MATRRLRPSMGARPRPRLALCLCCAGAAAVVSSVAAGSLAFTVPRAPSTIGAERIDAAAALAPAVAAATASGGVAAVAGGIGATRQRAGCALIAAALAAVLVASPAALRVASRKTSTTSRAMCGSKEDPTDPSLFIKTNVDLGDGKKAFMLACSKAVASSLKKPESYVAVCVEDKCDIIWGGSDDKCALCTVYSLGSINLENNKALTVKVTELLAEYEVPPNRIYVNFFDVPRENCGYNGATFAG
mmetsp:Transcript_26002/g.72629  ORF Transcript_26002/g.72629 Transcript_26002/m.72629 type:complete len:246 (+) Transcript_26002:58-795(+)|eukprot:CAMPEP_0117527972 /NCGR_PEP_ID=MMETSP0784-20121206/37075_1 /TAXON_ID=39447 /ORGANISM="" /LENGTH=245 /DNA_ID=CAMNT_0005324245 /DNA_START=57 /DNA_END=794 /DNA_ORIENTATION=+